MAEVAPWGKQQIEPAEKLILRLESSKQSALAPIQSEWAPRLKQALADLRKAATDHTNAERAYSTTFAEELSLRTQHMLHVDKIAGLARAAFPGDRATQDLIFPVTVEEEGSDSTDQPEGNGP
ncbi:MAG: hypothetical protein HYZ28_28445 [Myxococcales bacterium]|nr:hypothetical protein [Myxococcales bacterium]